jgi:hypothetical protein
MVLSAAEGRDVLACLERRAFGWTAWDALGRVRTVDELLASYDGQP